MVPADLTLYVPVRSAIPHSSTPRASEWCIIRPSNRLWYIHWLLRDIPRRRNVNIHDWSRTIHGRIAAREREG